MLEAGHDFYLIRNIPIQANVRIYNPILLLHTAETKNTTQHQPDTSVWQTVLKPMWLKNN